MTKESIKNTDTPVDNAEILISYFTLRKAVGGLGMALPVVMGIGGIFVGLNGIEDSISSYYHTPMRNIFVGTLCALAVFFFAYRGPDKKDNFWGWLACIFALGVAFFPTARNLSASADQLGSAERTFSIIHIVSAALFFSTLAIFSLCLFTKTKPGSTPTPQKKKRNTIYKICGWVMVLALIGILIYKGTQEMGSSPLERFDPVFWLEAIAIFAFGFSWFTKGEGILKDGD